MATISGKKKLIEKCLELIVKLRSQVEVDFYLQQISAKLGVGMESLYLEYNKVRKSNMLRARSPQDEKKVGEGGVSYSPSIPDIIAGYIFRYNFLDLFFREFRYTEADLTSFPDASLLTRLLASNLDSADTEMLNIIDLHLEEDHVHANPELIQRAFRDIIRNFHARLLENEKEQLLRMVDIHSPEYLEIYTKLSQKAKALGIPPGILKNTI